MSNIDVESSHIFFGIMELRHLRHFLAVAEELHFGRAAQRLHLSQPPLSLSIQQLEAFIGARLFERNSKAVRLTNAGKALLPKARALLDQTQEAVRVTRDAEQGLSGRLRIGFVGSTLYRGLPAFLQRFEREHPGLGLHLRELNSNEQLAELMHGQLDAGFVHTARLPPETAHRLYASEPLVACLPASHALARRRRIDLKLIQNEPFVLFARQASTDYYERILAMCTDAGFYPDVVHEARYWVSVASMVAHGLGVALVPAVLREVGMPGLAYVPVAGEPVHSMTYCIWKSRHDDIGLRTFVEAVDRDACSRGL